MSRGVRSRRRAARPPVYRRTRRTAYIILCTARLLQRSRSGGHPRSPLNMIYNVRGETRARFNTQTVISQTLCFPLAKNVLRANTRIYIIIIYCVLYRGYYIIQYFIHGTNHRASRSHFHFVLYSISDF